MDLSELKQKAQAAREFSVALPTAGGDKCSVILRLPTEHDVRLASMRAGVVAMADAGAMVVLERALLLLAVIGWTGVVHADVLASLATDIEGQVPFAFEAGATELFLDANPDWTQTLWGELIARLANRRAEREVASKN